MTKGKPTQGTQKACTQKGSLELKTCKLRGEYTQTQNTRSLIDFAETEQHQNHTLTPNTGRRAKYLIDFAEIEQHQNHTRTQNNRWGARYLIHYTGKEQQHQHNRVGKERERDESVRKEREVTGFIHAKGRGYAQTDTIPYRPGRRSSWSPTPGEHRNVPPGSRSTVDTNTVSPRYSAGRGTHTELSYRVPKAQVITQNTAFSSAPEEHGTNTEIFHTDPEAHTQEIVDPRPVVRPVRKFHDDPWRNRRFLIPERHGTHTEKSHTDGWASATCSTRVQGLTVVCSAPS